MKSFLPIFILFILFVPTVVFGQATLINLPNGLNPNNGFDAYINTLYALSISIAALLAVIKIVIAGVKWMTTDIVTSKGDAKKDIQAAVLGLLVIIGAVLIIEVINPDIGTVDLKFDPVSARDDGRPSNNSDSPRDIYNETLAGLQEGSRIAQLGSGSIEEKRQQCENIDRSTCDGGVGDSGAARCYAGNLIEFGPSVSPICVVSPTNNIHEGQEISCVENTTNTNCSDADCNTVTYDCSVAENRCRAAGYNFRQGTILIGLIERSDRIICTYENQSEDSVESTINNTSNNVNENIGNELDNVSP